MTRAPNDDLLSPHKTTANQPLQRAVLVMMWLSIIYGVMAIGLGISIAISLSGDQVSDGQRGMAIFFGIILLVVLAGMTVPMLLCWLFIRRGSRAAIVWGMVLNAFVALLIFFIDCWVFANLHVVFVFVSVATALLHALAVNLLWNAWKSTG